jgi:putative SOS response-associated peptidase YedK
MCNLYSMTAAREAMLRLFKVGHNRAASVAAREAIFPGHMAPVVRVTGDGARELAELSWGFVLPQADKAPRRVTNVRDDKARSSAFWRDSFETRRCLVPATSFCEPAEVKPATWHWFALKGSGIGDAVVEPRPLFAFAGVWRQWRGPVKKDGEPVEIDVFSFMTTLPNALVATINHERMPVLLDSPEVFDTWLNGTPEEAFALARSYPPGRMAIVQEGMEKRDRLGEAEVPVLAPSKPRGLFD